METVDDDEFSWIYQTLGHICYNNKESDAFIYYRKYLNKFNNDGFAYIRLAECYKQGIGVDINIDKALELYQQAMKTEFGKTTDFKYYYAEFLKELKSIECLTWFQEGAKSGGFLCAYNLSQEFAYADYLPADTFSPTFRINKAIYWIKQAIDLGREGDWFSEEGILAINQYNILMAELGLPEKEF